MNWANNKWAYCHKQIEHRRTPRRRRGQRGQRGQRGWRRGQRGRRPALPRRPRQQQQHIISLCKTLHIISVKFQSNQECKSFYLHLFKSHMTKSSSLPPAKHQRYLSESTRFELYSMPAYYKCFTSKQIPKNNATPNITVIAITLTIIIVKVMVKLKKKIF